MRAVIYCRVSTPEQAKNLSLPTQEKICREYCARHGYDVDQVFIDAESAKTTDRTEFLKLLDVCRRGRGRIHALVVYSLNRFARNNVAHHAVANLLRGFGIALRSATEPIDDTSSGRLMEGILAAMAQFDNDVRSERVTAGMKAAVERGRWVWPAPLGYRNANHRGRAGPSLEPDPTHAPAIREAFERCASGMVGQALLAHVRGLGLRTRHGHAVSNKRLYELLRHPVYAGRVRTVGWQKEERGDFEPLVSEDLFARVQARLNNPVRAAKTARGALNHRDFPLRRFVQCATCGRGLTGSWSTGRDGSGYAYYHCLKGCQRVRKATLEHAFLALMDTLRPQPPFWRLLEVAVLDIWRARKADATAAQTRARRAISALEAKLARVDEAYLYERTLDQASYQAHRDALRQAIALAQIDATEATVDEIDAEGLLAFAAHTLEHASALWTTATGTTRRTQLQWTLFPAGLRWQMETFVSPVTCLDFFDLSPRASDETGMVDRPTTTWKHAAAWLTTFQQLKPAA